jgi:hypothetical protein
MLVMPGDLSGAFLRSTLAGFKTWAAWSRLGWWMGYRAGWAFIVYCLYRAWQAQGALFGLGGVGLLGFTAGVVTVLAADTSRSAAVALPLLVLGVIELHRADPALGLRAAVLGWAVNLLLPAVHVSSARVYLIGSFPLELYRAIRGLGGETG